MPAGTRVVVTHSDGETRGVVHGYRFNFIAGRHEIVVIPDHHQGTFEFIAPLDVRPDSDPTPEEAP